MLSLSPDPGFEYYYKGDKEAKAVVVSDSPRAALADDATT